MNKVNEDSEFCHCGAKKQGGEQCPECDSHTPAVEWKNDSGTRRNTKKVEPFIDSSK